MASLQLVRGIFYVRFRYGRKAYRRALEISDAQDADALKKQVEINLHRIGVGVIPSPPDDADVPHYVLTGGKKVAKPTGIRSRKTSQSSQRRTKTWM
jgi:hypothetical protein